MRPIIKIICVVAGFIAVAAFGAGLALAVSSSASGRVGAFNSTAAFGEQDLVCTSSSVYVDMPSMKVTFKTHGPPNPAIVLFQGEWHVKGSAIAALRLVIDNVVQTGPGDDNSPFAAHSGSRFETNGFNFISNVLRSGTHTAKIQWATRSAGQACVNERTMIVLHR
jgi:hypothetical protein